MVYVPSRPPNETPLARHFRKAKPLSHEVVHDPYAHRRGGGTPLPRLGFGVPTAKQDISIRELCRLILGITRRNSILFPDTGFVTKALPVFFWRTVGSNRSVAFSPITVGELSGWRSAPMFNEYLQNWLPRAIDRCAATALPDDDLFRVADVLGSVGGELRPFRVAVAERSRFLRLGYEYYLKMLSLRKLLGIRVARELRRTLGREPTEKQLVDYVHNKHHPRGAQLALKGWKNRGARNYLADEELVITAIITAIVTGRETVILTWDNDVYEQFAKLLELLSTDYMCWCFAEVHFNYPETCPMVPFDFAVNEGDGPFADAIVHQMGFAGNDAEGFLPPEPTFVNTYCFLLGNHSLDPKVSMASFCLERELAGLLLAKGATGGKNTSRFPGKNMLVGTQLNEGKSWTVFMLGGERYVNFEGVDVSWTDVQHALKCNTLIRSRTYLKSPLIVPRKR